MDAELTELLDTALFDAESEQVDGGLVDWYEYNYHGACDALVARFKKIGFTPSDATAIRAALRKPGVLTNQGGTLLYYLEQWLPGEREMLLSDPDPSLRIIGLEAAVSIGPGAVPDFEKWRSHLNDSNPQVRLTAVKKLIERRYFIPDALNLLGKQIYDDFISIPKIILRAFRDTHLLCTLPMLLKAWRDPTLKTIQIEIHRTITTIVDWRLHRAPQMPPEKRVEVISALLDSLLLDRYGIRQHCKEALGALPVHATMVYLWAIHPDGRVFCVDHEAFGYPAEVETDWVSLFAVYLHAAELYPELTDAIRMPPTGITPCTDCLAQGDTSGSEHCLACSGMGWLLRA